MTGGVYDGAPCSCQKGREVTQTAAMVGAHLVLAWEEREKEAWEVEGEGSG